MRSLTHIQFPVKAGRAAHPAIPVGSCKRTRVCKLENGADEIPVCRRPCESEVPTRVAAHSFPRATHAEDTPGRTALLAVDPRNADGLGERCGYSEHARNLHLRGSLHRACCGAGAKGTGGLTSKLAPAPLTTEHAPVPMSACPGPASFRRGTAGPGGRP